MELDPQNPNWQFLKMIMDYQSSLGELKHLGMNDPVSSNLPLESRKFFRLITTF